MSIELFPVLTTAGMTGVAAYVLWRMREKDAEHQEAMERRDKLFAEAMTEQSKGLQEIGKALENLAGWLRGRLD